MADTPVREFCLQCKATMQESTDRYCSKCFPGRKESIEKKRSTHQPFKSSLQGPISDHSDNNEPGELFSIASEDPSSVQPANPDFVPRGRAPPTFALRATQALSNRHFDRTQSPPRDYESKTYRDRESPSTQPMYQQQFASSTTTTYPTHEPIYQHQSPLNPTTRISTTKPSSVPQVIQNQEEESYRRNRHMGSRPNAPAHQAPRVIPDHSRPRNTFDSHPSTLEYDDREESAKVELDAFSRIKQESGSERGSNSQHQGHKKELGRLWCIDHHAGDHQTNKCPIDHSAKTGHKFKNIIGCWVSETVKPIDPSNRIRPIISRLSGAGNDVEQYKSHADKLDGQLKTIREVLRQEFSGNVLDAWDDLVGLACGGTYGTFDRVHTWIFNTVTKVLKPYDDFVVEGGQFKKRELTPGQLVWMLKYSNVSLPTVGPETLTNSWYILESHLKAYHSRQELVRDCIEDFLDYNPTVRQNEFAHSAFHFIYRTMIKADLQRNPMSFRPFKYPDLDKCFQHVMQKRLH